MSVRVLCFVAASRRAASAYWFLGTHIAEHEHLFTYVCVYNKFLFKLNNILLVHDLLLLYDVRVQRK